jgi:hypothetical protein
MVAAKYPVEERLRDKWRGYLIDTQSHVTESPATIAILMSCATMNPFNQGWPGSARLCSTLILRRCERLKSLITMEDDEKKIVWINIMCIGA